MVFVVRSFSCGSNCLLKNTLTDLRSIVSDAPFYIHNIKNSFLPDLWEVCFGVFLMLLVLGMQDKKKKEMVAKIVSKLQVVEVEEIGHFVNGEISHDFWLKEHGDPCFYFYFLLK